MLGIIIAEKEEALNLLQLLNTKIVEFNGIKFFLSWAHNVLTIICFCGVGKANAAAATMSMINNFNPKVIFNIGTCGTSKLNINVNDIIIVDSVEYADVDLTAFNYKLNVLPNEKKNYCVNKKYIEKLKDILKEKKPIIGTIATSDSIISIDNCDRFALTLNSNIVGHDMELMAIAQICFKTKTDFFAIKYVSDNLTLPKKAWAQYDNSIKISSKEITTIVVNVIKNIFVYC